MTRMMSSSPPAATAGGAEGRVALWDNARLGLMVLVVFGHLIESLRTGSASTTAVYNVVYAFHMPAFFLVSGWFARAERLDARSLVATAKLLVTWLIAESAWAAARAILGADPFPATFLVSPGWTLWFLVTLFSMRVLLPFVALLRFPLATSVVVAVGVGLSPVIGTQFSASRTLAMLPFFVLGWRLKQLGVGSAPWFRSPGVRHRLGAGLVLAVGGTVVLLLMRLPEFTNQLLFWRRGYAAMDLDGAPGALLRLTMLAVAVGMTLAVLILIPRRTFWWSALGRNTMPVYLVHAPLIEVLRRARIDDALGALPGALVILLALSAAATLLLATPPIARLMRPVTDPALPFRTDRA